MRDSIGRKLIIIGAVGFISWLILDTVFEFIPYFSKVINRIDIYKTLEDKIFESDIILIAKVFLDTAYYIYILIILLHRTNEDNWFMKINGIIFMGFYSESVLADMDKIFIRRINFVSAIIIIVGIILIKVEWFRVGYRIENYGKAILTVSTWIMLILAGSYAKLITRSIGDDYSVSGMSKLSKLLEIPDLNRFWLIRYNIFFGFMCLILIYIAVKILKALREDYAEIRIINIILAGIVIILIGIYSYIQRYPEAQITNRLYIHWFVGIFLIIGGILNYTGNRLDSRSEIVEWQDR